MCGLNLVTATLNSRPGKILGWKTPAEALDEHLWALHTAGVALARSSQATRRRSGRAGGRTWEPADRTTTVTDLSCIGGGRPSSSRPPIPRRRTAQGPGRDVTRVAHHRGL